ncbi:MAG: aminotransferase class V-fold PLP-dependent enzyme [Bacteroidota bacterium]|nr:aminotransferase class V-fold PLP-dependent enzyme [Bacteroidota bacterium]
MQKSESGKESVVHEADKSTAINLLKKEALEELKRAVYESLVTYSNVHRGTGHYSMVTTHLYEQAREIVIDFFNLDKKKYTVIFCTPWRAEILKAQLRPGSFLSISSNDINLPLGIRALAVARKALPRGIPFQTGGGTTRLVSPGWVIWAGPPERFEAGTPAIINVIAFARALSLTMQYGNDIFRDPEPGNLNADMILYNDELEGYSGQTLLDELRRTLLGRGFLVPAVDGSRPYINLDNGASTPTFTPVWNTVWQTWCQPSQVRQSIIQEVRSLCSEYLGAPPTDYDVIFTSNTTEAINMAALSLGNEFRADSEPVVINTILEHTSNDLPWRNIPGCSLIRLNADNEGIVDLMELESLLAEYNLENKHGKKRIKLLAMTGASNVLGVFNDLAEISKIVHKYGARLFIDGAQMVAHRKVEIAQWGIDYLAFSAHKAYAPFGTGVLVAGKGFLSFSAAEYAQIRSSGEENVGGIAALGKMLALLKRIGLDLIREEEQVLTRRALDGLSKIDGLRLYGIKDPDSPGFARKGGVIVFIVKGMLSPRVARELAERGGIGVRSGCHCAHILVKHLVGVGPFLEKFQKFMATMIPVISFPGIVRISLGIENTKEDIDTFLSVLSKIAAKKQPDHSLKSFRREMNNFVRAASENVYKNQLKK